MITESAIVVEVSDNSVVVETVQQSTCGSCSAQKGCGQGVLAKYLSSSNYFRLPIPSDKDMILEVGDSVTLGIDEFALVRASIWLYLVPLFGLLLGAYFGNFFGQLTSILFALVGLCVGALISWSHAQRVKDDPDYAPKLLGPLQAVRIVDTGTPS